MYTRLSLCLCIYTDFPMFSLHLMTMSSTKDRQALRMKLQEALTSQEVLRIFLFEQIKGAGSKGFVQMDEKCLFAGCDF